MKIYIHSCHAALEYDHARLFTYLGHAVSGRFDVGSTQRPKVPGVTDQTSMDWRAADLVILHQTADFEKVAESYAAHRKAVILTAFGQGASQQHNRIGALARIYPHLHVAAYSQKERHLYQAAGVPAEQLELIRFTKPCDEFTPDNWSPVMRSCLVPCNDIHRRGDACGWAIVRELLRRNNVALTLCGNRTEEVGGLGAIDYDVYRDMMRQATCYLAVGTIPAPYTMTLVEAACAGVPIVALNNQHGISEEGFGITLGRTVDEVEAAIYAVLRDDAIRARANEISRHLATTEFSYERVTAQWAAMLNRIHS